MSFCSLEFASPQQNLVKTLSLLTMIWKVFFNYKPIHLDISLMWPKSTGELIIQWLFWRRNGRRTLTLANQNKTPRFCAWLFCDLECRFRRATAHPSPPTKMGHPWLHAVLLPTVCSMVSRYLPYLLTNLHLKLFHDPNPAESWYCKISVFLPQKVLFGSATVVSIGLCFLLISNVPLILKLRKIFHLLRPSSMWIYNRTEELSPW